MTTKNDTAWTNDQKIEDVAEKTSHSSAEPDGHHVVLDEAESARVLRKVDMRLVPMLSLLYLVAFIDRSNSMSTCTRPLILMETANVVQLAMQKPQA